MRRLVLPLGLAATFLSPLPLWVSPVWAQPTTTPASNQGALDDGGSLTLERALALAEARSYALAAAQREVQAAGGSVKQAGTRPNPELGVSVEDTQVETRTSTLMLNMPLELGGKRAARVAYAERGREVAVAELAETRAEIRSQVISAFFLVLVAQERVRLAEASAEIAKRGAKAATRRVEAGKISPVDETRAKVEQANADLEVAEAKAELQSARQGLAVVYGAPTPGFSEVRADLEHLPERPDVATLMSKTDQAPGVMLSRLRVAQRNAAVDVERSKRQPDWALSLGANRDNELGRTQAVIGVSVTLPLFDRNEGNIYEAAQRASKAADEHQAQRLQLLAGLQQASTQLSTARASASALRTTVLPAAQAAQDAATKGFDAGKFGLLDVLDTQRTLLQARVRYLDAVGSAYQAAAAIDRLLGQ